MSLARAPVCLAAPAAGTVSTAGGVVGDLMTIGALEGLRKRGSRVPRAVALVALADPVLALAVSGSSVA